MILPVFPYEYTICSVTLREEHSLRVSEIRVLKEVLGSKREEATGRQRNFRNMELHHLYYSQKYLLEQIKEGEMAGTCGTS